MLKYITKPYLQKYFDEIIKFNNFSVNSNAIFNNSKDYVNKALNNNLTFAKTQFNTAKTAFILFNNFGNGDYNTLVSRLEYLLSDGYDDYKTKLSRVSTNANQEVPNVKIKYCNSLHVKNIKKLNPNVVRTTDKFIKLLKYN